MFGYPEQLLSDRGAQWCANKGGTARFDLFCSEKGIEHIMGRVGKPTARGKIERWYGSVLEEAEPPPKGSPVEEYRRAVLEYVEFHNNRHPHRGIGLKIPVVTYLAGIILTDVFTELGVHEVP